MRVDIILEPGESRDKADELLLKALESHTNGDAHEDNFDDSVMQAAANEMIGINEQLTREMVQEIEDLLEMEAQ